MMMVKKIVKEITMMIMSLIDDDGNDTDSDDTDDVDDDDSVNLGMPGRKKCPSMAWKNFTFFTTHTCPITYHSTFRLNSFVFLFLSLKVK